MSASRPPGRVAQFLALGLLAVACTPGDGASRVPDRHDTLPTALPSPEASSRVDALLAERRAHGVARVGRAAVCFAPGTSVEEMHAVLTDAAKNAGVATYQASVGDRWAATATDGSGLGQGDATTLTWSVVPDGTDIRGYVGEARAGSNLRSYLTGLYGSESNWLAVLEDVFERWGELTGVRYVHETNDDGVALSTSSGRIGVRGDIRIGGHRIDGTSGTLAYNFFPDDGDMVLDTSDGYFSNRTTFSLRLRNVISHEHGHGLGLEHVCPVDESKLMEPFSSTDIDGPQHDDILGAQRLYGDRFAGNDSAATAAPLGLLEAGAHGVAMVSIDDDSDEDWYAFSVPDGASATVQLHPIGESYREGAQNANGGCGAGSTFDSLRLVDLQVAFVDIDGTSVLGSSDSAGRGGSETVAGVSLPRTDAQYYVRVRGDGTNDAQLYELALQVESLGSTPVARDDVAVAWQDMPIGIDVLANDEGVVDTPLSLRVLSGPTSGVAEVEDDLTLRYTPGPGFIGSDRFQYEVGDAEGQTSSAAVEVDVRASPFAGDARSDTDADGYPDELEAALGTELSDPSSAPADDDPGALQVTRLVLRLKPTKVSRDVLALEGRVPIPAGFEVDGSAIDLFVGGVSRRFLLDRRGKGRIPGASIVGDEAASFRLRVKKQGGSVPEQDARFEMKIKRGAFAGSWTDEGIDSDRTLKNTHRAVTVFVVIDRRALYANVLVELVAKAGKKAVAKLVD